MKKTVFIFLMLAAVITVSVAPVMAKAPDDPSGKGPNILSLLSEIQGNVADIPENLSRILLDISILRSDTGTLQTTMDSNFTGVHTSLAEIDAKLGAAPSGSSGPVIYHTGPFRLDTTEHVRVMCLSTNQTGPETADIIFSQTLNDGSSWDEKPHSEVTLSHNTVAMTDYVVDLLYGIQKVDIRASSESVVCTACYPESYGNEEQECYQPGDFSVERVS